MHLSFSERQIDRIKTIAREKIREVMVIRKKELGVATLQLSNTEKRLASADEKFFDEEINKDTYKRWHKKLSIEIAHLKDKIAENITERVEPVRTP